MNQVARRIAGRYVLVLLCLVLTSSVYGSPQGRSGAPDAASKNPLEGDADAVRTGGAIFRSRCTSCHGADARGWIGPDLTSLWASGATDARLFQTIQRGVPGTEMPSYTANAGNEEIWQVLAYLRTLNAGVSPEPAAGGDRDKGARLFQTHCSSCHLANGRGGRLGPDLSYAGSALPRATLVAKIRGMSETFREGYEPVTLVMRDGGRVRGLRKNEDDFSIQIMDTRERLQGYLKSALKEIVEEKQSVMPRFGADRLSDAELTDLLAYVGTLRRTAAVGK